MTGRIKWTVSLVLLWFMMTGTAYGQDEGIYRQSVQQILQRMEASGQGESRVETGIVFPTVEAASAFADYFYEEGYGGAEQLRLGVVSYSDRPSYYEIVVLTSNPQLAASQQRLVEGRIRTLSDSIKMTTKDDFQRAEMAYDWIYQNMEYDYSLKNISLYQALETGKTICSGYAGIFQAICNDLNLECEILYGDNHAWNKVRLNGEWRYVDITWDKGQGEHNWRFVTEETWNLTHPCREEGRI